MEALCATISQINFIDGEEKTTEYPNVKFTTEFIDKKIKQTITNFANNGYPFIKISPKINQTDSIVAVDLLIEKGIFVKDIQTHFIIDKKLKEYLVKKPIEQILQKNSEFYSYSNMETTKHILQNKKYVNSATFFSPEMKGSFCEVPIKIEAFNSVLFDGGLGFVSFPKIAITGNANLNIVNILGFGEALDFSYTAEELFYKIDGNFEIPYFLKTPFGLLFTAQVEIADSLYGSTLLSVGTEYFFAKVWTVKMHCEYSELSRQDSISRYSGIKIIFENGKKKFSRLQKNSEFEFSIKSGISYEQKDWMPKGEISAKTAFQIPVASSNFAFLTKPNLGIIAFETPQSLHKTQLFRLGGANSVRGYQENSFPALAFGGLLNEFRYYIADFSAIYLLGDYATLLNNEYSIAQASQIFGYGIGISLPVKKVSFSLEWARHINDISDFGRLHFRVSNH
jgi:outer membrane protein assembly factor BamA